ncbi:Protein-arginine deiminase type-4 [Beauveria bassiana]|nr:Protein-arginine deiminase type-4 [Beauveria bassiana]KAH8707320.1 Protein-arginine deiminase type-4 [Beauveria bassiana]
MTPALQYQCNFVDENSSYIILLKTRAAVKILEGAKAEGHGDKPYKSQPETQEQKHFSVNKIFENGIKEANEECARRIAGTIEILKRETGISDDEIFRVPVLYTKILKPKIPSNGDFQVGARYPNGVNGLVLTDSFYLAPKQWGLPNSAGIDTMQQAVEDAYKKAGFSVEFVDEWDFHSRKGDIHCLTNVLREIPGSQAALFGAPGSSPASGGRGTPQEREKELCKSLGIKDDDCRPRVSQCIFEAGKSLRELEEDDARQVIRQCVSKAIK